MKNKNISIDWWYFKKELKANIYTLMYARNKIKMTLQTGIALEGWVHFNIILMDFFCQQIKASLKEEKSGQLQHVTTCTYSTVNYIWLEKPVVNWNKTMKKEEMKRWSFNMAAV